MYKNEYSKIISNQKIMKFMLALLLIIASKGYSQSQTDTLKNETIIKLTKNKLPESVIILKINQSTCSFDVSVDGLIKLKDNQVTDNVINLMIEKQGTSNSQAALLSKNNSNDKNYTFPESGIYFERNRNYISLDPTIVSTTTPTRGMFNIKYESQIEGSEANYQLNERRPAFYFNFESVKKSLNDANANTTSTTKSNYLDQLFSRMGRAGGAYSNSTYQAVSPNDFKLVKLAKVRGKREFVAGKVSAYGQYKMSIDGKSIVDFKYEKVSENTYKIIFAEDLKPGEYCFIYLGNNNNAPNMQFYGQNNLKVFDFGISD
jgi:hypothetical protein